MHIRVLGAGLAGCEAALYLAGRGYAVELWEQKPHKFSPAHKNADFAELVCSNSLKADRLDSASGLLKAEMKLLGSALLPVAEGCRVAAGGAQDAAPAVWLLAAGAALAVVCRRRREAAP